MNIVTDGSTFFAICKSWNRELRNGMRGMMATRRIRVGTRGIRERTRRIKLGMRGIMVGMRGVRVGMGGIRAILCENLRVYCFG